MLPTSVHFFHSSLPQQHFIRFSVFRYEGCCHFPLPSVLLRLHLLLFSSLSFSWLSFTLTRKMTDLVDWFVLLLLPFLSLRTPCYTHEPKWKQGVFFCLSLGKERVVRENEFFPGPRTNGEARSSRWKRGFWFGFSSVWLERARSRTAVCFIFGQWY